jgi:UDP-2-acetamido-2-deoxy-ribo-hexuluronate aminotransferase
MIACPRAVTLAGMVPVFVDCDEQLLLDKDEFARQRNSTPEVVMTVHVHGRQIHEDVFYHAGQYNWYVIEDLAEAHGIRPHSNTDAACWSFQSSKVIHAEEGGAAWFRDKDAAKLARSLRTMGFTEEWDYMHLRGGINGRMSNAHATMILDSLHAFDANMLKRRAMEAAYNAHCPNEWRMPERASPWIYDARIPGLTADRQRSIIRELQAQGVPARFPFRPMHVQEEYEDCRRVGGEIAERMSRELICLPLSPERTTAAMPEKAFRIIRAMTD